MAGAGKEWVRLGDGSLPTEDADVGLGHIVSLRTYYSVYFSLLMLTAITVWAATQDFGVFSLFVALLIATVKAGIVTLFFMHLNFESKIIWGIVIYPLFIFVLILAGTLGDRSVKRLPSPIVPIEGGPSFESYSGDYPLNKSGSHTAGAAPQSAPQGSSH